MSAIATTLVYRQGWTLYFGDAEAHLNIARRVLDSRTPGYDQIGTVWLPLPHLLTLVLVWNDGLWRSGLAGAIPSSICFILAGLFLFALVRRTAESSSGAWTALAVFALNPNLLYLQSTPMTEAVALAAWMAVLYCTIRFRESQSWWWVIIAAVASVAASLSRYEGWFLIPFVTAHLVFKARTHRFGKALLFASLASLGPLYWLAHNWWLYSNAFEFYNGPYSAKGIYAAGLRVNGQRYFGDHDWYKASLVFCAAARLCSGWGLAVSSAAGFFCGLWKRALWPIVFAALPPLFYVWSIHSGGTPIVVPALGLNGFYNSRYGLAALPLLAICAGFLAAAGGRRGGRWAAAVVVVVGLMPWLAEPKPDAWITWQESRRNSEARRAWTTASAAVMSAEYHRGEGILTNFGDLAGIFRESGISLRETLHEGNSVEWNAAVLSPEMFLHEAWVVGFEPSDVVRAARSATVRGFPRYHLVHRIAVTGAPAVEIYRRYEFYELPRP
ncbi:MAG TPA: glycosyltransferase family 39 protein [Bryobacteraceae bacterium]|nr:glycosyltransferase family 39 protein [Bryobacteraceae bacterium]